MTGLELDNRRKNIWFQCYAQPPHHPYLQLDNEVFHANNNEACYSILTSTIYLSINRYVYLIIHHIATTFHTYESLLLYQHCMGSYIIIYSCMSSTTTTTHHHYHQLLELFRSLFDKDQMSPEGGADRSMDLAHLLREHYRVESFHHLS